MNLLSKFLEGAWLVALLLIMLLAAFRTVKEHDREVARELTLRGVTPSDGQLAWVLLPEFVPAHWWQHLLHNQTAWAIKLALLYRRRRYDRVRVILDVPWHLRK